MHGRSSGLRPTSQHLDEAARAEARREAELPARSRRQGPPTLQLQGEDCVDEEENVRSRV